MGIPDNNVITFSPNNGNDTVIDEKDNIVIANLWLSQLRSECLCSTKTKENTSFILNKILSLSGQTVKNQRSPATLFKLLFDDEVMDMILHYTKWIMFDKKSVTKDELYCFIGIMVLSG